MNLNLGDAMVLWKQNKINGVNGMVLNKKTFVFGLGVCAHKFIGVVGTNPNSAKY